MGTQALLVGVHVLYVGGGVFFGLCVDIFYGKQQSCWHDNYYYGA